MLCPFHTDLLGHLNTGDDLHPSLVNIYDFNISLFHGQGAGSFSAEHPSKCFHTVF